MTTEEIPRNEYTMDVGPTGQKTLPELWIMASAGGTPADVLQLKVAVHRLNEQKSDAQCEAAELRQALAESQRHMAGVVAQVEDLQRREKALQGELLQVHDQWYRNDVELQKSYGLLKAHRDELEAQCLELHQWLQRVQQSLPGRLMRGLRAVMTLGRK